MNHLEPVRRRQPYRTGSGMHALAVVVLLVGCGCSSTNLSRVHDAYIAEFEQNLAASTEGSASDLYPRTTALITEFRRDYSGKADALKHLAVLETMVFLDAKEFGRARLAITSPDATRGSFIDKKGAYLRDEFLFQALTAETPGGEPAGLIEAFETVARLEEQTSPEPLNRIGSTLKSVAHDALESGRIAKGDGGAIYVAGTAAVAFLNAAEVARGLFVPQPSLSLEERQAARRAVGLPFWDEAIVTLEPFLTEQERQSEAGEAGRAQYVDLYHRARALAKEARGAT